MDLAAQDRLDYYKRRLASLQQQVARDCPWDELSEFQRKHKIQGVEDSRRQRRERGISVKETLSTEQVARVIWEKGVKERVSEGL